MIDLRIFSERESDTKQEQAACLSSEELDFKTLINASRNFLFSPSFFLQLSSSLDKAARVLSKTSVSLEIEDSEDK